ncbi:MAG: hybrid sensor histidine kinase/response regulator [Alphaproteobacteria bacterium]|nr:hybrid sensor histidine kinase/response regulator [Alphaproteobacteria bacterium]
MDDLIAEFLTETNENMAALDLDLVKLEQTPNDKGLLSNIFRMMHTVKGTCGFLGLSRLEKVAHHAENIMGRFRDGDLQVTPDYMTLIFESIDRIKMILSGIEETGSEPQGDDSVLIEKLDAVYEGRALSPVASVMPDSTPITLPVSSLPEPEADEHGFVPVRAPQKYLATPPSAPTPASAPETTAVPVSATPDEPKGEAKESAVSAQTLRVNVDVLENLMTMVSELVLTRNQLLQISRAQKDHDFAAPLQRLNHVVSDLQEGVMKTRMQPIGNAWSKLPRIIRDLSMELGKKIDLDMRGAETELDRQVLEMIKDPLTHMVRNSADHGIEKPEDRVRAGKPETGKVILDAYHEGGHIIIEIKDDGKGLPMAKIKEKILKNGLASESEIAAMSDQQIQQYIFKAGFSTAEKVTSVSGRGVGMDVVRTNIERIGGAIELRSIEGQGSKFLIKIPLTLAIVSALIVESGRERFAIPQLAVRELVIINDKSESKIEEIKGAPVFRLRNMLLPLVSLKKLLKLDMTDDKRTGTQFIVVTQIGNYTFGIIVDKVFDTEEIVVKPVAQILKNIDMFSGNTILGDGSVIMILDPTGIAKATGEIETSNAKTEQAADMASDGRDKTSLLLFRSGTGAPKAVPLALVARLEEITLSDIESAGDQKVIQYRGELMPLIPYQTDMDPARRKRAPVLVFIDETRSSMGLVIDQIIDITEEYVDIQVAGKTPELLGSAIIRGEATDVVDISYFLMNNKKDWFKNHGSEDYAKPSDPRAALHAGVQTGSKNTRILLVDDSPFFRNMLEPLLRMAGYDVTALENPADALKLCDRGDHFDLIVSDIEMPGMDGFEFAEKIRAGSTSWKSVPMVALTSHNTQRDIARGAEVGFNKYVAKFDRETLLTTLSQTLNERGDYYA